MTSKERLALFSWKALKPDILRPRTVWLILFFFALKWGVHLLEDVPLVQRTLLPGVDVAMRFTKDSARRTVVVGITPDDIAQYFRAQRPIPPESLLRVVETLLRLEPAALVVDVFTEDSRYAKLRIPSSPTPIVWAQSADTSSGNLLRVLGGRADSRDASALAAMLAEQDGLVRRVRLRFGREKAGEPDRATLALATINACRAATRSEQSKQALSCELARNVPSDTSSVALRAYIREPAFFTLGDVLLAAQSAEKGAFSSQIMVLGFVDGSDQVATPFGIRPGPWIVADAIETLMDERGLIRRPPIWLGFGLDALAMLLVIAVGRAFRDEPHRAALWTLGLGVVVYAVSRLIIVAFNYWTTVMPMMLAVWAEQLYDERRKAAREKDRKRSLGAQTAISETTGAIDASPSHNGAASAASDSPTAASLAGAAAVPTPAPVPAPPPIALSPQSDAALAASNREGEGTDKVTSPKPA
ncbi:MAG: CHASE2 domain-containing protein [Gemmatimonadaceae bacterium]